MTKPKLTEAKATYVAKPKARINNIEIATATLLLVLTSNPNY
jgi:hypothetical protein